MSTVWSGVRLVELLDTIVEGKRQGFEGLHGHNIVDSQLYNDPYHNYFCEHVEGGFILALHPDVKPFVEALNKPNVTKHCWFGRNGDSAPYLTAAMVAERYDIVALKCDEKSVDQAPIAMHPTKRSRGA